MKNADSVMRIIFCFLLVLKIRCGFIGNVCFSLTCECFTWSPWFPCIIINKSVIEATVYHAFVVSLNLHVFSARRVSIYSNLFISNVVYGLRYSSKALETVFNFTKFCCVTEARITQYSE
jgi:hypothetical protein